MLGLTHWLHHSDVAQLRGDRSLTFNMQIIQSTVLPSYHGGGLEVVRQQSLFASFLFYLIFLLASTEWRLRTHDPIRDIVLSAPTWHHTAINLIDNFMVVYLLVPFLPTNQATHHAHYAQHAVNMSRNVRQKKRVQETKKEKEAKTSRGQGLLESPRRHAIHTSSWQMDFAPMNCHL